MIRLAIAGAYRHGRHIGTCGQAPSDFPEVTRRLVDAGIDSISLNPDTVVRTIPIIFEAERRLADTRSPIAAGR